MPVKSKRRARAVWPNPGVERWYKQQLVALLTHAHFDIATEVGMIMHDNPPDIGFANDAPSATVQIDRAMKSWAKKWTLKFDKLSLDLAKKFAGKNFQDAERGMRAAFRDAGLTVKFDITKKSKGAYKMVVAENVNLIKSIPQKYLTDVQSNVWASVMKGGDMASLSRKLKKTYDISTDRAALIARDQNNKAKAIIENVRRQEIGITEAIWQHSSAGREPRPTHVAMDGKTFKLAKGMYDSDEGEYVYPGQLINCRCTSRAIIKEFEGL